MSTDYEVCVKSLNENEFEKVQTERGGQIKECIKVKKDNKYEIHIHNKSYYPCDVRVSIGNEPFHTWRIEKRTVFKITEYHKKSMDFKSDLWYMNEIRPIDETCVHVCIRVTFIPCNSHKYVCNLQKDENGNVVPYCYDDIDWSKIVHVEVPILICS